MQKHHEPPIHTSLAIIGAGFCGTMLAVNFIKQAQTGRPFHITLIEKSGQFGPGVAYRTHNPFHLLNIQADKMGAFADDPEHFFKWMQANKEFCCRQFPALVVRPESFVPRRLYGIYLEALFEQTKMEVQAKGITLVCITGEAVAACATPQRRLQIKLKDQSSIDAEAMILATSLPPFRIFEVTPDVPESVYTEDIWNPPAGSVLAQADLSHLAPSTRIAIIGSGLTMVDTVVTLLQKGFDGEILVLSKHGMPPEPHLEGTSMPLPPAITPLLPAKKLIDLMRIVRNEIAIAERQGINWRSTIDSLRPVTVSLWKGLPLDEKKRFIRHLFSQWNRVRHRIPPQSYQILQSCQKKGKLHFISECVKSIIKAERSPKACIIGNCHIEADYVLNCSGAHKNIHKVQNPLLHSLLQEDMITSNALNIGIEADEHCRVKGKQDLPIYALGQLLIGQRLESVAIPELREQCKLIVDELLPG